MDLSNDTTVSDSEKEICVQDSDRGSEQSSTIGGALPGGDFLNNGVASLFENSGDPLAIVMSESHEILWMNPSFAGRYPEAVTGSHISELVSAECGSAGAGDDSVDDQSASIEADSHTEISGLPSNIEICFRTDNYLLVRLYPEQSVADHLKFYLSEREALFNHSRTLSVSEMATTLAHELNQPLGTIGNVLQGLKARLSKDENITANILSAVELAEDQTRFAANIISRIRSYTQTKKPEFRKLKLASVVKDSISLLDWVLDAENVSISSNIEIQEDQISGDETMIQQVLINLMRNGIDAMRSVTDRPRRLHIGVYKTLNGLKVECTDNGAGFTDEDSSQVYVPFHTTKADGMGVGLNICRSFIELHRGRLWLTPGEEVGCTAHVLLPYQSS